jgi:starch-binding outer membrane protein, SusD/RagB family
MIHYKKISKIALLFLAVGVMAGCTKLKGTLNSTLTSTQATSSLGSQGAQFLLAGAYADLTFLAGQDQLFSLEENSTDESLVPTRGGDWDDNGVWRVVHNHTWNADHGQILSVFNDLNKVNFDATNVLGFNPTPAQAAQAKVLRAFALYYLLDLYGQYPIRNPGDNLLLAPVVRTGAVAIDSIINDITTSLPNLPAAKAIGDASRDPSKINADVANVLLMKCYLQKGTFTSRAAPTFDPGDMANVVTIGSAIMDSGKYTYSANYFDNFSPQNHGSLEAIWLYPNTGGVGTNHAGTEARWNMTLHYNSWDKTAPNAGWNGFSTVSDFYNSFGTTATPVTATSNSNLVGGFFTGVGANNNADTIIDQRLGGRIKSNFADYQTSGIRSGFLIGQQYNENGVAEKDRKGNPLAFDPNIAATMIEQGANLELTGIRLIKYPPDYNFYGGPANNDLMIYRYPDVVLMVAEAKLRINPSDGTALTLVNVLRAMRGAAALPSISLVNTANIYDPNTILTERGRELYWESFRRTDMQRFGVFNVIWQYKPTDDAHYLLFPIPNQALAANPNLVQNSGY